VKSSISFLNFFSKNFLKLFSKKPFQKKLKFFVRFEEEITCTI